MSITTFINANYRTSIAILALGLALALAIILNSEPGAMAALAEGFGWGGPAQDASTGQFGGQGFGWGSPPPVDPSEWS
ncbi:hypothetical protein [Micromonospora sp. NPDC005197]|uniref:hypothetical protein n=1 Tax=unclassified Micromonospora TaxID=2617518 RepID=UPI0033A0579C